MKYGHSRSSSLFVRSISTFTNSSFINSHFFRLHNSPLSTHLYKNTSLFLYLLNTCNSRQSRTGVSAAPFAGTDTPHLVSHNFATGIVSRRASAGGIPTTACSQTSRCDSGNHNSDFEASSRLIITTTITTTTTTTTTTTMGNPITCNPPLTDGLATRLVPNLVRSLVPMLVGCSRCW